MSAEGRKTRHVYIHTYLHVQQFSLHVDASNHFRLLGVEIFFVGKLLKDHDSLIDEKQPRLVRNCSGYYLRGVASDNALQMPRMLVGSEGTLGMFTAATLHTAPLPAHRGFPTYHKWRTP